MLLTLLLYLNRLWFLKSLHIYVAVGGVIGLLGILIIFSLSLLVVLQRRKAKLYSPTMQQHELDEMEENKAYEPNAAATPKIQNYTYVTNGPNSAGHGEDAHVYDELQSAREPVKRSNSYQPTTAAIPMVQSDNYTYVTTENGEDAHTYI